MLKKKKDQRILSIGIDLNHIYSPENKFQVEESALKELLVSVMFDIK